jgi:GAF domain-containing protein
MEETLTHKAMIAAVSGALADPGPDDRALLTSITDMTRSIFGAAASSILLLDRPAAELVFEAVSGEGEEFLVGTRFSADRGIAGWVVATGEPMAVDDLASSQLFARDLAESTRYVPNTILAVPVTYGGDVLGVLQVLDPQPRARSGMAGLDLLTMVAAQAGLSLHGLIQARTAQEALVTEGAEFGQLAALVQLLAQLPPEHRTIGLRLVDSLHELLTSLAGCQPEGCG